MKEYIIYNSNLKIEELKELNIFISSNSVVQDGAKIYYNSCISGDSVVYSTVVIYNNSTIIDSVIRNNSSIYSSRIENCEINENCMIGPFANIKDSEIGGDCKVGNFVEMKNSSLSNNVSVLHLSSIQNTEIGSNTVIGSGVVFSSSEEQKILIGDNVKIGANSSLIAPLTISDDSYIAIGSVINCDVDAKEYAIARAKQQNSEYSDKKAK